MLILLTLFLSDFMLNKSKKQNAILLSALAKGAVIIFIGILISKVFGYFFRAILARFIGGDGYGLFSLGFTISNILVVFALIGLPEGLKYFIPFYESRKKFSRVREIISFSFKISLATSIIAAVFLFLFSQIISENIFGIPALTSVLRVFAFVIPCAVLSAVVVYILQAFRCAKYFSIIRQIIENISRVIFAIVFIFLGFNVIGATLAHGLAFLITFIIGFIVIEKKVFPFFLRHNFEKGVPREVLSYSFPLFLVSLIWIPITSIDTIFLGFFRTTFEVGVYNVIIPTANLITTIPEIVLMFFLPLLSSLYGKRLISNIKSFYITATKWTFMLSIPFFILMLFYSRQLIHLLFGESYVSGALSFSIVLVGYFFVSLFSTSTSVLQVFKKQKKLLFITIITCVSVISFGIILIPFFGLMGAALSTSVSLILFNLLCLLETKRLLGITPIKITFLKPLVAAFLSFLILYLLQSLFKLSLLNMVIFSFLYFFLYFILLIVFKSFEKEEIELIKKANQKLKKIGINLPFSEAVLLYMERN